MKPHYKEIAEEQKKMEYMQFRKECARRHAVNFGYAFSLAVTFVNPLIFDTHGTAQDEAKARKFKKRNLREMGFFVVIGEN